MVIFEVFIDTDRCHTIHVEIEAEGQTGWLRRPSPAPGPEFEHP